MVWRGRCNVCAGVDCLMKNLCEGNVDAGGNCLANREKLGSKSLRQFHDLQRNIHRLLAGTFFEIRNKSRLLLAAHDLS